MRKIAILGTGTYAMSIAFQLSKNEFNKVTLFGRDKVQCDEINTHNTNSKYFDTFKFSKSINAANNFAQLHDYDIIIIATPSRAIFNFDEYFRTFVKKETLIINMSKGLLGNGITIYEYFFEEYGLTNFTCLKGPSFSSELIRSYPTLLTLAYSRYEQLEIVKEIFNCTDIYLDYSDDIIGVEYLSALKNIYAIYIGNIDAKFNSLNTRYFCLTQCFSELHSLLKHLNCKSNTIGLGCGLGDFCLTSLSDLSRNRTLGLMIGKGFFDSSSSTKSVVIEGVKTLELLNTRLDDKIITTLPILNSLIRYFITKDIQSLDIAFSSILNKKYKTVLTYGTFDLLHYGHIEILKRAKSFGDRLIVGLSTDDFNLTKGKVCEFTYEKRKQYLESFDFVDLVIPENSWDQKIEDVKNNNVDFFVMGDDWKGKFDFLNELCEVVYLPRTEGISTTQIKKILKESKS